MIVINRCEGSRDATISLPGREIMVLSSALSSIAKYYLNSPNISINAKGEEIKKLADTLWDAY